MADFPTLSRQPAKGLTVSANNSGDIRHEDDAGYVSTRRRYTRAPKVFAFSLKGLTVADYIALSSFIATVTTVASFNWLNPVDDLVYVVRFKNYPDIVASPPFYSTSIVLEEV